MNLVGYTTTALSRNDIIDTPTNKNIVDFSIVELKDYNGNLVTIYDDINGTNPETQKTCDADGQLTFFAEAGDYILEVNGRPQYITISVNITVVNDVSSQRIWGDRYKGELTADVGVTLTDEFSVLLYDGNYYSYTGSDPFPIIVASGTVPTAPDYKLRNPTDHDSDINRNAVGAHDDIYIRTATLDKAVAEDAPVGTRYEISDRANGAFIVTPAGVVVDGYGVVALPSGKSLSYYQEKDIHVDHFGATSSGDSYGSIIAAINYSNIYGDKRVGLGVEYTVNNTINLPIGVTIESPRFCVIHKNHAGDGIVRDGALAYDYSGIKNVSVTATPEYTMTGTGIKLIRCVRNNHENINATECAFGLSLDGSLSNYFGKLTADRCGYGIWMNQGCNFNEFDNSKIISDGGIGLYQFGVMYANQFNVIDIEYALYPIWFGSGVRGTSFNTYYQEFSQKGIRVDSNVDDIMFDNVFNSSVPMFDKDTFASPRRNITVKNITDEFPIGLGGVDVSGEFSGMGIQPIGLRRSDNLGISNAKSYQANSVFGFSGGSIFEWTCEGSRSQQYVNNFQLDNPGQWSKSGSGSVTLVSEGGLALEDSYTLSPDTTLTHPTSSITPLANRSMCFQVWVKGSKGDIFELRMTDNLTQTQVKQFEISSDDWCQACAIFTWGAGSTGSNMAAVISTKNSNASIEFTAPNIYEGEGARPTMLRPRLWNGYVDYKYVKFFNHGRNVEVYSDSAPSSGTWVVGDRVLNRTINNGGKIGWIFTAEGFWKGFGIIDA